MVQNLTQCEKTISPEILDAAAQLAVVAPPGGPEDPAGRRMRKLGRSVCFMSLRLEKSKSAQVNVQPSVDEGPTLHWEEEEEEGDEDKEVVDEDKED